MQAETEQRAQEIRLLRGCLNDLIGLQALPAIWSGGAPPQIVETLLDVLLDMLDLDFVYAHLNERIGQTPFEAVRLASGRGLAIPPQELGRDLNSRLRDVPRALPLTVPSPIGDGDVSIVPLRLGQRDEIGLLVAASVRLDFPTPTEKLVLNIAANQAAIGLHDVWRLREKEQLARELDQRVHERTKQLVDVNAELRNEIDFRKRVEFESRRKEAYLAEAQSLSHTGSFGWNLDSGEIYWSEETFRIFGYEPTPFLRPRVERFRVTIEQVVQRAHPEDRPAVLQFIDRVSREREAFDFEHRLLMPDGSVKHLRVIGNPDNATWACSEFVGAVTDITDRKRAESELRNALDEIKKLRDQLYQENIALREEVDKVSMFEEIMGESQALHAVLARVAKVAPMDSTVLITGETGTGKELIARAIHKRSTRCARVFVSVNCAAIPVTLIASELFGHEKGAFTGALQRRLGRFELAEGGTIFLDEIGELPPEVQIMLLRVLQEREFERVGGNRLIRADVRVIAATNRDLPAAIDAGTFRSDLYYRLNVFPIEAPSLRERKEDIPLLVRYFVDRYSSKAGKKISRIDTATLDKLKRYNWPGNVRELQNVVERSVIVCETEKFAIDESWLSRPLHEPDPASRPVLKMSASEEKKAIEVALADSGGRVSGPSGAAAKLGVPPSTLDSKINALKIDKGRFKSL